MAKLKAVLEKSEYDTLADALKECYSEHDGKYVLDADVDAHPSVQGLKNSVAAIRAERSKAEADLAKFKQIGDPEKAAAALAKVQELEETEAKKAGEWEKLKQGMVERHAQEKAELAERIKNLNGDIERLVVDAKIVEALSDPELKVLSVKALLPHVKQRVKSVKEGEAWVAVVHDGKGNASVGDGSGSPMTIKQLALEMRKDNDYAPLFGAQSKSGSGMPSQGAGAGSNGAGAKKTVKKSDTAALSENLEGIAKGEVLVED